MKKTLRQELEYSSTPQYHGSIYPTIGNITYAGSTGYLTSEAATQAAMRRGEYGPQFIPPVQNDALLDDNHSQLEDELKSQEPERKNDVPKKPLGLPQNEDELLAMIQQLRADIEREREINLRKDDIIGQQASQLQEKDQVIDQQAGQLDQQAKQIHDLRSNVQELRQDKSDLREHVLDLREANLEKAAKLKQSDEIIAKQKSEYDLLKDQFDSIVGLGVHQQDEGSQLSGASNDLSIGSFELVGDQ